MPERLDAYATERHYLAHLLPVWWALGASERGTLYVPPGLSVWMPPGAAMDVSRVKGIASGPPPRTGPPVLVASYWDARRVHTRPVIMMEHGVGQTYSAPAHDAYAGGGRRDHVVLFLCPTQRVADANRARYPDTPSVVVGSPRLDRALSLPQDPPTSPVVAVSFHWPCNHCPETRSALSHYRSALPALVTDPRWIVVGHCHPRDERNARRLWKHLGVEFEPDFERVLDRADLLVCDTSSVLYEMAATGRPVVVLDAPWYRRDVEHGLRFWSHADIGIRISEPGQLVDAVAEGLTDPRHVRRRREALVADLFGGLLDGRASERAVQAIRETLTTEVSV